jgi:hypothetical protein
MTKITPLVSIVAAYRETNDYFLNVINKLSDSQIRWRPNSSCHSIAFILWHVARWTDFLQATIPGMTEELAHRLPTGRQVWDQEHLAAGWGMEVTRLGYDETGTDADIEELGEPNWPKKDVLLAYAQRVFSMAEGAISAIDEEQFQEIERQQYDDAYMEASRAKTGTVGNAIVEHLVHNTQHLGEMFYLRGLLKHSESSE